MFCMCPATNMSICIGPLQVVVLYITSLYIGYELAILISQ